jgi:hypothetical protein
MVTRCERRDACTLEATYKTSLCGFDPIPAAEDRTRGVAVRFSCYTGGDPLWDKLASHPLEDPFDLSDLTDLDNPATSTTVLRGTLMELRCPFDSQISTPVK